ncbi:HlyD family type I secretion periplasmic adaptor subunit [Aquisalimonas lutea]|uniref:HlyD family type I secretion periplasmic adaptor subunit n=1 Tax=Aquisalimonas lutea TaxID=1327750 RepID=UPI0025B60292|nr:HlyD family type I secretion periplasmic adaptor subunit [Aquisalimonas lutea]MDN3518492.1 HlyD family type I secretion periplasmic adaptor subunit [Aquisalimonas lutea]
MARRGDQEAESAHVEAHPDAALHLDARRYLRGGLVVVLLGFIGLLLWAGLAPLDKGVAVPATVTVSGNRKAVQPTEGGRVERLLVSEGAAVDAGDVLLRLNDNRLRSEAEALRVQWLAATARAARLRAESSGAERIAFPEVLRASEDPRVPVMLALQRQLLDKRRAALRAELQGIEEKIAGSRASLSGLSHTRRARQRQRELLVEQIEGLAGLVESGYVARNRFLELRRESERLEAELAEDRGRMNELRNRIAELEARARQRREEHQREVDTRLTEVSVRADELRARLDGVESRLADTVIRAPASGRVVGLKVFTEGGVVAEGATLMEIVPGDAPLLVEGRAPVSVVDRLHAGLAVDLMFTAFNQSDTPRVPGEVTQVSADRLVDDTTNEPYYRVEIRVERDALPWGPERRIRPGMSVEAFVRTGERTLLSYLFKPLMDRLNTAFAGG